jgi:membrane-associated phospholipid phosphatase
MTEPDIEALNCNASFGKPSGHAMSSIVMVFLMPFLIFPELYDLKEQSYFIVH